MTNSRIGKLVALLACFRASLCWVTLVQLPEISVQQLMSDFNAQHPALDKGMVIVEPGIDSRHLDLLHQFICTCEGVRRRVRDQAVHGECEVGGSEIASQNG